MYLFEGNKDTLYRIHGTNQPEYIGQAISSGCIRMTNEDVIDLYKRVKPGTVVVVLAPHQGDSPFNPRVALAAAACSTDLNRLQRMKKRRLRAPFLFCSKAQAPSVTRTISGGTPSRSGTLLQPSPPDTIMWRPCSTIWP